MKRIFDSFAIFILIAFFSRLSANEKSIDNSNTLQNTNKNLQTINKIAFEISGKEVQSEFKKIYLFNFNRNVNGNDNAISFVTEASLINIRKENLNQLLRSREENILFNIPVSENIFIELELTQSFPVSDDFSIFGKSGKKAMKYLNGLHYKGIIKGKENSVASISIFKNHVMGIISDETGNYVLGSVKNSDNTYSDEYIFYNDADLVSKNKSKCGVDDYGEKLIRSIDENKIKIGQNEYSDNPARLTVKIYFEADYQTYIDEGSNLQNVGDFIIGFFNSVQTIYLNEGIPVEISQIGVWDIPDPYINLFDSYDILTGFGENNGDNFQGNLAHLVSTRNENLGGIAWTRVLCLEYDSSDFSGRFAFSDIYPDFNNFPVYSWTVNVVAHEIGHNFGSRHTHACVWPVGGLITAIDSCYTGENCIFPQRAKVGTIMSYCHLWIGQGGGVNFSLGFGPLPGDTIRLRYAQASCLDRAMNSSEVPSSFDLSQNFPNPFNPVTKIKFALPAESNVTLKIYDVNGRLVADLIKNKYYNTGFHDVEFNSSLYNLSSGIYFYKLEVFNTVISVTQAEVFTETKRMVLVK